MAKYRKKPVVVEAEQWFKNGDHSQDNCDIYDYTDGSGSFLGEGKIVRYYRHPVVAGDRLCEHCGKAMHVHGWMDTLEGDYIVCPGDFIITGIANEKYPCKPDIFEKTYEPVDEEEVHKALHPEEAQPSATVEVEQDGKLYRGTVYLVEDEEDEDAE